MSEEANGAELAGKTTLTVADRCAQSRIVQVAFCTSSNFSDQLRITLEQLQSMTSRTRRLPLL